MTSRSDSPSADQRWIPRSVKLKFDGVNAEWVPVEQFLALRAEVKRLRELLDLAKAEHYCGVRRTKCGSPFCDGMRAAGEKL